MPKTSFHFFLEIFKGQDLNLRENRGFLSGPLFPMFLHALEDNILFESGGIYFKEILFKDRTVLKIICILENKWHYILTGYQISFIINIIVAYQLKSFSTSFWILWHIFFLLHWSQVSYPIISSDISGKNTNMTG